MTLSEFIKQYREEHGLSVRAFSALTNISPQQVINIEKGIGSNGKPMTSTMKTYKKIADGIGMSEQDFLAMLNDNVVVNPSDYDLMEEMRSSPEMRILMTHLNGASKEEFSQVIEFAKKVRNGSQ